MRSLLKKPLRQIAAVVVPFLISTLMRFIHATNKNIFHGPEKFDDDQFIMACWHGDLCMIPYAYMRYKKKVNVKVIVSEHFDGEIVAKTLGYFGFKPIRGSSTRGGTKALIGAIKELKGGYDLGITPDGPRGPRHKVHDGVIAMAQKTKVKIAMVQIKPKDYWQLKSWDKFVIPKPFGIIDYYISDLVDISDMQKDEAREFIQQGMLKHER